jgi:hypothetical protein
VRCLTSGRTTAFGAVAAVVFVSAGRVAWTPAAQLDAWPSAGLGLLALTALVLASSLVLVGCLVALAGGSGRAWQAPPAPAGRDCLPRQWDPDAAGHPRARAPGVTASPRA